MLKIDSRNLKLVEGLATKPKTQILDLHVPTHLENTFPP